MAFDDDVEKALKDLKAKCPNAEFQRKLELLKYIGLIFFQNSWNKLNEIKVDLKGTDVQVKVWEKLLKILVGKLSTYGNITEQIGNPNASQAVGTAIGSNPVAFLIPFHRIIQSSGNIGGYMWGNTRKTTIIGWVSAKTDILEM